MHKIGKKDIKDIGSVKTTSTNGSTISEFGGYLTEQNMLNYFSVMFNQEPKNVSVLAINRWKEMPKMTFNHI